jgi:hypothetical protein
MNKLGPFDEISILPSSTASVLPTKTKRVAIQEKLAYVEETI